jgi:hypothetical protein
MFRWLNKFFYSDDPIVKVVGSASEPEAEMWRELLENNRIRAFVKIVDPIAFSEGRATGAYCNLFVKKNDLERAREILGSVVEPEEEGAT